MIAFDLAEPRSLEEAISLLDADDPGIRPIGGGTALMLMMKAQLFRPVRLVSLRHLGAPFTGLGVETGAALFRVGSMTTFSELEHSAEVKRHLPAVVEAMAALANVRVRNVATVGGNLAHADPHLDLPPLWMALDAELLILGPKGQRRIPVEQLFAGYYETTLNSGELIAELRVPLKPGWRSTYVKVTTRAVHDWPAVGVAISLELAGNKIRDLRLVLSAALDRPTRLVATEEVLRGAEIDEDTLRRAGEAAVAEADIGTDDRGSADYKSHLLRIHLSRAIRSLAVQ
jgi:aerobic carbon-monoxide dehydrogenase medium subunit